MSDSPVNGNTDLKKYSRSALELALIYVVLGLLWILFSDEFLAGITRNPDLLTRLQTAKGWLFVAFTGLLLFILERQKIGAYRQAENVLRQRNREADLVNRLSRELNATLELDEVIATVLQEIRQALGVMACSIWLVEAETNELVCQQVADPRDVFIPGWRLQPGQGVAGWVVAQGQSTIVADTLTDERYFGGVDEKTGVVIRSILAVPLTVKKNSIGVIEVVHTAEDYFKSTDLVWVELLATAAASAIENANLYGQLQAYNAKLEERVAERTQELTQANERLQELDRLKSKFVSDVTHELRSPITNLLLNTALLEVGKAENRDRYIAIIKDQAGRLQHLVDDTLNLSRMEMAQEMVQTFTAVNLNDLIEQTVAAHMQKAEVMGLKLVFSPASDLPLVKGNRNQLAQLATNLITNALNYTPVGQVQVKTCLDRERNQACLIVEDTGLGMEPEDLVHLFERFYRGRLVGHSEIPGTGLGLAIVKEIVDLHNGDIEVESEVGVGSIFRVWLPLVNA